MGDVAEVTVRHLSKDHVVINAEPGWSIAVFNIRDSAVEATATNGEETIRLLVEAPGPGRKMSIERVGERVIHFRYTDE